MAKTPYIGSGKPGTGKAYFLAKYADQFGNLEALKLSEIKV